MQGQATDRGVRLDLASAEQLATRALIAARTAPDNAGIVARALVRAEADGQGGHGLSRIPSYTAQSRSGKVDGAAVPTLSDIAPGAFAVDGAFGFAFPAIAAALPELVRRARVQGIAAAAIRRSHHFGVGGHPCEDLATLGLIGFIFGNAPAAMAPAGGRAKLLGTNPIAFAAPIPGADPLVIDLATSTVARGKILAAREAQRSIPAGWALDAAGNPTTDAVAALAGTVVPMGGAKGAALALMVEVMAACLTGGTLSATANSVFDGDGPAPDLGQTLIAIDPDRLSGGAYAGGIASLTAAYAADGARLPGARRLAARAAARDEGLWIDPVLLSRIEEIAG